MTLIRLWITEKDSVQQPVVRLIIYIILIFGSLIHSEIIVLNFCGMQKNTKLFLEEKEKMELNEIGLNKSINDSNNLDNENIIISIDKDYDIILNNGNDQSHESKEMANISE